MIARALLLMLLLVCSSCTALKAHVAAHYITQGLYSIDSYQGRTSEHGLLRDRPAEDVVRTITYERMWKVRAEVVSPEEFAGELFIFDGSTITAWWPRFFFGLRIRGVEVPPRRQVGQAILESSFWNLKNYDVEEEGPIEFHAGRKVRRWKGTPRRERPYRYPYRVWMDTQFNVPLKVKATDDRGRPWYRMRFDEIEFGAPVADDAFAFEFPEGAVVHEWNLSDPGVTLAEAQALAEFPVLVPEQLPKGHRLNKIVVSSGEDMHMVALLMEKGARWLSLSELPNMGPILVPEIGIPVTIGEQEGVLNFALGYTLVSWAVDNTALTLIGNLPWPEMLEVAASVKRSAAEEK